MSNFTEVEFASVVVEEEGVIFKYKINESKSSVYPGKINIASSL